MRLPHVLLFSSIFNFGFSEGLLPEGLRCSRPERLPEEIGVASPVGAEPSRSVNLRILHGQETKWNWPFIVRLGMRDSNGIIRLCGGTVLNQRWIITGTGSEKLNLLVENPKDVTLKKLQVVLMDEKSSVSSLLTR